MLGRLFQRFGEMFYFYFLFLTKRSVWCPGGPYTVASTNLKRDLSFTLDIVTLRTNTSKELYLKLDFFVILKILL